MATIPTQRLRAELASLSLNMTHTSEQHNHEALVHRIKELESLLRHVNPGVVSAYIQTSHLVESIPDMFVAVDADLHIVATNQAFREFAQRHLNAYQARYEGVWLPDLFASRRRNAWEQRFRMALSGQKFRKELHVKGRHSQDEGRYFELSFGPVCDEAGMICGASMIARDNTFKRHILETIREKEQFLSSINYSIQEGIFRSAPDRGIIYVNKAFVELFGYHSAEEVVRLDPYALYQDMSRRDDFVRYMRDHERFINEEVLFKRKDGSTFWGLISSVKVVHRGRIYYDGAIRDITESKEAKTRLQEQYFELQKVNQELDRFVYSSSHDLRAPLMSLLGLIDIARIAEDDATRTQYLDLMVRTINQLDGFIRDIIDYSRNARQDFHIEAIDFRSLIDACLQSFEYMALADRMHFDVQVDCPVPFHSDRLRINIVLRNIIENAIRYQDTAKDQPYLHIAIEVREEGARLTLADNGIGIEADKLPRIFDMFYRGHSRSNGSGIGLYIVREVISKLAGDIQVQSEPGRGTTFTLFLPHRSASL
ncbi:MAG: hypothetical protein OHK0039_05270 [Bacteroidia bacterium]